MHTLELLLYHSPEFVLIIILLAITKRYIPALIIAIILLFFHRIPSSCSFIKEPKNQIAKNVVAPAYGTVRHIVYNPNEVVISIFLNVDDIHTQYVPYGGRIKSITSHEGNFFHANSDQSNNNSRTTTEIETIHGIMTITQISGMLARKIVVFKKVGDTVKMGELLGFIRFGSRCDIHIPINKNNFSPTVREGDKVNGPEDILGSYDN